MTTLYTFRKMDWECAAEAVRFVDGVREYVEEVLPVLEEVRTGMQSPCDPEELFRLLNQANVMSKTLRALRYLSVAADEIDTLYTKLKNA